MTAHPPVQPTEQWIQEALRLVREHSQWCIKRGGAISVEISEGMTSSYAALEAHLRLAAPVQPTEPLTSRITAYLAGGGLFNPELANHDAVRDLLIDCREALARPSVQPTEPVDVQAFVDALPIEPTLGESGPMGVMLYPIAAVRYMQAQAINAWQARVPVQPTEPNE